MHEVHIFSFSPYSWVAKGQMRIFFFFFRLGICKPHPSMRNKYRFQLPQFEFTPLDPKCALVYRSSCILLKCWRIIVVEIISTIFWVVILYILMNKTIKRLFFFLITRRFIFFLFILSIIYYFAILNNCPSVLD